MEIYLQSTITPYCGLTSPLIARDDGRACFVSMIAGESWHRAAKRVWCMVDSRPTVPVRENKCMLPRVDFLSQNIYGTRVEDGGDLMFALIYYEQRASYLAGNNSLRAGYGPPS